jgi:hypothetical protein
MELTCPECCYDALQKVRKNQWECEVCGTSFNFAKMRSSLDAFVGRQFQEDFIDKLLNDAKLVAFSKLGERAWKWTGKYGILYTLDTGNGWHIVIKGQKVTSKSHRSNVKS